MIQHEDDNTEKQDRLERYQRKRSHTNNKNTQNDTIRHRRPPYKREQVDYYLQEELEDEWFEHNQ